MFRLFLVSIFFTCDCYIVTDTEKTTLETVHEPIPVNTGRFPVYWDWREHNKVTPVKSQEDCNACWAFSAVGMYLNMEGLLGFVVFKRPCELILFLIWYMIKKTLASVFF